MGTDLDGTGIALIMRAMDEVSRETARPQRPLPAAPGEATNPSATTSLVLGISAFAIQLLAWGDLLLRKPGPEWVLISSFVSLVWGICAIVYGVKGRRLAKANALGRITATIGLVLGIVFVAIPTLALLAFIVWINCCLDNFFQGA
jgi:hypothetical protein